MFDDKNRPNFSVAAAIERFKTCSRHEALGIVRMVAECNNLQQMEVIVRFLMEVGTILGPKDKREYVVEQLARRLLARHWLDALRRSGNEVLLAAVIRFYGVEYHCFPYIPQRDMRHISLLAHEACQALWADERHAVADPAPHLVQQRVDAARITVSSGWYRSSDAEYHMLPCYLPTLVARLADSIPNHGPEIEFAWRWEGLPIGIDRQAWRQAFNNRTPEALEHDAQALHRMCERTAGGNGPLTARILALLDRARYLSSPTER